MHLKYQMRGKKWRQGPCGGLDAESHKEGRRMADKRGSTLSGVIHRAPARAERTPVIQFPHSLSRGESDTGLKKA